jgi:hypothetical protein
MKNQQRHLVPDRIGIPCQTTLMINLLTTLMAQITIRIMVKYKIQIGMIITLKTMTLLIVRALARARELVQLAVITITAILMGVGITIMTRVLVHRQTRQIMTTLTGLLDQTKITMTNITSMTNVQDRIHMGKMGEAAESSMTLGTFFRGLKNIFINNKHSSGFFRKKPEH